MRYVDGFLLPVRKRIFRISSHDQKAGKIRREHGALEYREWAGDDLNVKGPGIVSANDQARTCLDRI